MEETHSRPYGLRGIEVEGITFDHMALTLLASSTRGRSRCPLCGRASERGYTAITVATWPIYPGTASP